MSTQACYPARRSGPTESNPIRPRACRSYHPEHLHDFVAQVVDHLHRDAARAGLVEGARGVAVEGGPRLLVDLGLERGLQRAVGIVGAEEVGVADEKALLVVVGVDEPARDAIGAVAADLALAGVEDVHAIHLHPDATALGGEESDVGLAEDDEEVALAGILQVLGHVQVGIHARLEHGDAAELAELRGMRLVVEGAGDEHVGAGMAANASTRVVSVTWPSRCSSDGGAAPGVTARSLQAARASGHSDARSVRAAPGSLVSPRGTRQRRQGRG